MKRFLVVLSVLFMFNGWAGAQVVLEGLGMAGSLGIGARPMSVFAAGRYAYVVDRDSMDLKVINIDDPSAPSLVGDFGIGEEPASVFATGGYVYVVDRSHSDLKVINVEDPSAPSLVGRLVLGGTPMSLFVSGRYAYVVDGNDLKIIDVSSPDAPSLVGSLNVGAGTMSVAVAGRWAYVVCSDTSDLNVLDVSSPDAPVLVGSAGIGRRPGSIAVSGTYAYVVDTDTDDLKIIDMTEPMSPLLVGSLGIGGYPTSVVVSGAYAYVTDASSNDLKIIDVSDPGSPYQVTSLAMGNNPMSMALSGLHAYVVCESEMKVINVSGMMVSAITAYSLETGSLQVKNDVTAQGNLRVSHGVNVGSGGIFSDGDVGVAGSLALANTNRPTSSPRNLVQLYAEDVSGSSELKVRDEAGNITTLSPHNFSVIGKKSEPMAWSFYSENKHGKINVDMLRAIRLIESVTGEQLVHTEGAVAAKFSADTSLKQRVEELETANNNLILVNNNLRNENTQLKKDIQHIKTVLGLD